MQNILIVQDLVVEYRPEGCVFLAKSKDLPNYQMGAALITVFAEDRYGRWDLKGTMIAWAPADIIRGGKAIRFTAEYEGEHHTLVFEAE